LVAIRFGLLIPASQFIGKTGFLHQSNDWLRRSSPKWSTVCWVRRYILIHFTILLICYLA